MAPERFYDVEIGIERRRKMFETVDLHGMNDGVDSGGPFREMIYGWAEKYPEFRLEIRLWHDRWIEMATPRIDLSWASLYALKAKGVPVFALSNFGIDSFAYAKTKYPELGAFDQRCLSGHIAVIKPVDRIYQVVEDDCGLKPENLLFTNARQENIDAAADRGTEYPSVQRAAGLGRLWPVGQCKLGGISICRYHSSDLMKWTKS